MYLVTYKTFEKSIQYFTCIDNPTRHISNHRSVWVIFHQQNKKTAYKHSFFRTDQLSPRNGIRSTNQSTTKRSRTEFLRKYHKRARWYPTHVMRAVPFVGTRSTSQPTSSSNPTATTDDGEEEMRREFYLLVNLQSVFPLQFFCIDCC